MLLKRVAAEAVGTFGIVFPPIALSATSALAGGAAGLLPAALISGFTVTAMIYALGPISAAHFNPAVTLGFAVTRRFPWRHVPSYWAAQFTGALVAALAAALLYGPGHGVHVPAHPNLIVSNVGTEVAITFLLMLVIMAVATDRRIHAAVPGLAIGLTVICGVLIGGPVTGGSMNPARSAGPALVAGGQAVGVLWLYFLGPLSGAVLGALAFEGLRIRHEHAVGAPGDLGG